MQNPPSKNSSLCILLATLLLLASGCGSSREKCGNGKVGDDELCDGTDLAGADCVSRGFSGGTLVCTDECIFDTSGCTGGPVCGDGTAEGSEACDGADLDGEDCASQGFTGGTLACAGDCSFDTSGCTSEPVCGDGVAEGTEDCDGTDLDGEDCVSQGFTGGTLACTANCVFATGECTQPVCGDGVAEGNEDCDGADLAGDDCMGQGFSGGTLGCAGDCTFDTSGCIQPVCGDGVAEGDEPCDGVDLNGQDCSDYGYSSGTLACWFDCSAADTSGCTNPVCGDDAAVTGEVCDGQDLSGWDCVQAGFTGGTLACNAQCNGFDTSGCTGSGPVCGDGVREGIEPCEGADLNNQNCETIGGFVGGTLACAADCTFDTSGCLASICGDGVIGGEELCDGMNLNGLICVDLGYNLGTLTCGVDCFPDVSACSDPICGDDAVRPGETCDGTDLQGQDCVGLGFEGGTLGCNANCTEYDTLACAGGGSGQLCEACDPAAPSCDSGARCLTYDNNTFYCGLDCSTAFTCPTGYNCVDTGNGIDWQCRPSAGSICDQCTPDLCPVFFCGDGVAEGTEQCDGGDLTGLTCQDLGYSGGTLTCAAGCIFDQSGCTASTGLLCETCDPLEVPSICQNGGLCLSYDGIIGHCGQDCSSSGCPPGYDCYSPNGVDWQCVPLAGDICDQCTPVFCPTEVCGDNLPDPGEDCDGWNLFGEDCVSLGFSGGTLACGPGCTFDTSGCTGGPVCGDGLAEGIEECDGVDLSGEDCSSLGFSGGNLACEADCSFDTSACTTSYDPSVCGDGLATGFEYCDGPGVVYLCADLGLGSGDITCAADCRLDFSVCSDPDYCTVLGIYDDGVCDPCEEVGGVTDADCAAYCPGEGTCADYWSKSLQGFTCAAAGFGSDPDCTSCGNDVIDGNDVCDGSDMGGRICELYGFAGGIIGCTAECTVDLTGCVLPTCGDGVAEGAEACDGADLDGRSCLDFGFTGGSLGCSPQCNDFDTSGCNSFLCGDGVAEGTEDCDGSDLRGQDCQAVGWASGTLACAPDCTLDNTFCSNRLTSCGDGVVNGFEECEYDPATPTGDCTVFGLTGSYSCTWDCLPDLTGCSPSIGFCELYSAYSNGVCDDCVAYNEAYDTECDLYCGVSDGFCEDQPWTGRWSCTAAGLPPDPDCGTCGNGVIEWNEQCDGSNLDGLTCANYGYASGTLTCSSVCIMDLSGCSM